MLEPDELMRKLAEKHERQQGYTSMAPVVGAWAQVGMRWLPGDGATYRLVVPVACPVHGMHWERVY